MTTTRLLPLLAALLLLACGPASPDMDGGAERDAGLADGGVTDAGTGLTVEVGYLGGAQQVALGSLPTTSIAGKTVVALDQVVYGAFPAAQGTAFTVSFRASDGFDPASRSNCMSLLPLSSTLLPRGGIDPLTRNLTWDDALGYPGCLYVRDLATLTLTP
ncbi:MAG: hypothetical protein IT380_06095 [Myxococcales bacterium]|nr:hypothetical protein [Myxococcales bacterium]